MKRNSASGRYRARKGISTGRHKPVNAKKSATGKHDAIPTAPLASAAKPRRESRYSRNVSSSSSVRREPNSGDSARIKAAARELKPDGIGIAVKICIAVSVLLLLATASVGYFLSQYTAEKVTEEIKKKGVGCANSIAPLGEVLLLAKELDQQSPENNGITPVEPSAPSINELLRKHKFTFKGEGSSINAVLTDKDILEIKVLDQSNEPVINALRKSGMGMERITNRSKLSTRENRVDNSTITIGTGIANMENGQRIHCYQFIKEIYRGNRLFGKAIVLVSSEKIQRAKEEVLYFTGMVSIGAVIIGIIIAVLIATNITKPIKTLVRDMQIVSQGKLRHRTTQSSRDEVGLLAHNFNKMTADLEKAHKAEVQQQKMNADLKAARDIQERLLPKKVPRLPSYDMKEFYRPSRDVGGDYYDTIVVDKNHLGLLVADVSGKGVQGGLVMTIVRTIINIFARKNLSTADVLRTTNQILAKELKPGMFVTAFYLLLHVRSGTMTLSSAGHNDLIIYRKAKGDIELINPKGIALGLDKGKIFERTVREEKVKLYNGDRVLLYTDGVVEAMNSRKEEFGDEQLYNFVRENAELNSSDFVELLVSTLDKHKGKAEQHDDITIFTFKVGG